MSEDYVSKDYIHNFNNGYTISEHMPQLSKQLAKALEYSDKADGFLDGQKQFEAEKTLERTPDWLRADWHNEVDKGDDLTLGKEDLDREL